MPAAPSADVTEGNPLSGSAKTTGLDLHAPFGGTKYSASGTSREQGDA